MYVVLSFNLALVLYPTLQMIFSLDAVLGSRGTSKSSKVKFEVIIILPQERI